MNYLDMACGIYESLPLSNCDIISYHMT